LLITSAETSQAAALARGLGDAHPIHLTSTRPATGQTDWIESDLEDDEEAARVAKGADMILLPAGPAAVVGSGRIRSIQRHPPRDTV
jgi:hypothetical protein